MSKKRKPRNKSVFAVRLNKLMKERGLTGYSLSRRTHLGANTIYYYIRGEREPDITSLRKLMRAFPDVSLDWLIGRSNYQPKVDQ